MRSIYASIPSLPTSPGVRRIPGLSTAAALPHPLPLALEVAFDLRAADEPRPCALLPEPSALALVAAEFGTARKQPGVSSSAPKPQLRYCRLAIACGQAEAGAARGKRRASAPSLPASAVRFLKGVDLKGVESKMSSAWPSASCATMCRTCFFQAAVPCKYTSVGRCMCACQCSAQRVLAGHHRPHRATCHMGRSGTQARNASPTSASSLHSTHHHRASPHGGAPRHVRSCCGPWKPDTLSMQVIAYTPLPPTPDPRPRRHPMPCAHLPHSTTDLARAEGQPIIILIHFLLLSLTPSPRLRRGRSPPPIVGLARDGGRRWEGSCVLVVAFLCRFTGNELGDMCPEVLNRGPHCGVGGCERRTAIGAPGVARLDVSCCTAKATVGNATYHNTSLSTPALCNQPCAKSTASSLAHKPHARTDLEAGARSRAH